MTTKILQITILWLAAEALVWLPFRMLNTYTNVGVSAVYFSGFILITIWLFRSSFWQLLSQTKLRHLALLMTSLGANLATYWVCHTYLSEPTSITALNPASFTLVNQYFIWVKPIDALLQQLMLFVLVQELHKNGARLPLITTIVTLVFGVAHLYAVQRMELPYALMLTGAAIVMSLIIPRLLLRVKAGHIYSYMLHLAFVDVAALFFWAVM